MLSHAHTCLNFSEGDFGKLRGGRAEGGYSGHIKNNSKRKFN